MMAIIVVIIIVIIIILRSFGSMFVYLTMVLPSVCGPKGARGDL